MTGVLIADEQGLGKTVQALAVCEAANLFPAVVISPTSVRVNWSQEIAHWLPHRSTKILYGRGRANPLPKVDVLIVGWDTLHSWADKLPTPKALIIDEAHLAKNGLANRTKAVVRLADRCHDNDNVVIALTGTPILNRVNELVSLLRIINRLDEFGGPSKFRNDYGELARLPNLNHALRKSCFVRRKKIDVLKELPAKRYVTVSLEPDEKLMVKYREAERHIIGYLARTAEQAAIDSGASTDEARAQAVKTALKAVAGEQLVAINSLRRLAVQAKLASVDQWFDSFMESGEKVVVFAWHREIVEHLANKYSNGLKIYGGMNDQEKQQAIDAFQTNPHLKVLVCSIKAAGVGITLTAASNVVFIEQGWTPADQDQATDRCHRIGQTDSVTAWTLNAAGTIDDDISELIHQKRLVVNAGTDGDLGVTENSESVLTDLVIRLALKPS